MSSRMKLLVDLLATSDDSDWLEEKLVMLCEQWHVEISYMDFHINDCDFIDFVGTLHNLAKFIQTDGDETLIQQSYLTEEE